MLTNPSAVNAIGVGQVWTDVTASRANDVLYTNATGRPISVLATCPAPATININGVAVGNITTASAIFSVPLAFVVPAGGTYLISSGLPSKWWELR